MKGEFPQGDVGKGLWEKIFLDKGSAIHPRRGYEKVGMIEEENSDQKRLAM